MKIGGFLVLDKKLKDILVILAHLSRKKEKKLYKVYRKAKMTKSIIQESSSVGRASG